MELLALNLSQHFLFMHIAKKFLRLDKMIIGLRLDGGPCFFLGLGSGVNMSDLISLGCLPVSAISFRMSAMPWYIVDGLYFTYYSAFSLSSPTLLPFFMDFAAFKISSWVKGVFIFVGGISTMLSLISGVNIFMKWTVIDFACSSSDPATDPSFVKTVMLFKLVWSP